jgi:N-acyl-D-aspartate/D-glutamate deacylase
MHEKGGGMFDLIIEGGTVIDGTGAPGMRADVALKGDRIAEIGNLTAETASARIDASGRVVAPGFIDSHCHSDLALLDEPTAECKACQGVTTEVIGNCGWSVFPMVAETRDIIQEHAKPIFAHPDVDWHWSDLEGYWAALMAKGAGVNVASLIGHGFVRNAALGYEDRQADERELNRMREFVQDAMDQGALGLSTGLCYAPGLFANTEEVTALASVAGDNGGLYVTHLRNQVDGLVESVEEALDIGRNGGLPVLVSHHKSIGKRNWGKVKETLKLLADAREAGTETFSDVYPYTIGASTMMSILPPWALTGSLQDIMNRLSSGVARAQIAADVEAGIDGWENRIEVLGYENIFIAYVNSDANRDLEGLSLKDAAQRRSKPCLDFILDLLVEEKGDIGRLGANTCEEDIIDVLSSPYTMIGSDGIDAGAKPHPRLYSTFPRVLSRYVREQKILSLEEGVRRMTGLTASTLNLPDIGFVRVGYKADLVIFDPKTIQETNSFKEPRTHPVGIDWVFVGGVASMAESKLTGELNGQVLRRKGVAGR